MAPPTTTARSSSSAARSSRHVVTALGLVLVLTACVPPLPDEPRAGRPPVASPAATAAPVATPGVDPVLVAARESVGGPAVDLAETTLDLARRVDFLRHEVPRGRAQQVQITDVRALARQVEPLAAALTAAVDGIDAAALPQVDAAARALLDEAAAVTAAVGTELDALEPFAAFDVESDAVVDGWTVRGSRSEFAARMDALAARAAALVPLAEQLPPSPPACPGTRENRLAWAQLIAQRTAALREVALAAAGTAYDELRAMWSPAPYGEDRAAADAESRACWAAHTPLLAVPDEVAARLADLEHALGG